MFELITVTPWRTSFRGNEIENEMEKSTEVKKIRLIITETPDDRQPTQTQQVSIQKKAKQMEEKIFKGTIR